MTKTMFGALHYAANLTVEFVRLLPNPYVGQLIQGFNRDVSQLLAHLAQIPREEMLLMQGYKKQQIMQSLRKTVAEAGEFQSLLMESINDLERFVVGREQTDVLRNANGTALIIEEWCLETLMHFCHHRAQILSHLAASTIIVPRGLLKELFVGHL